MTSSEIIEAVMEAAAEATETGTKAITSKSRIRETVDARHIAIKTMYDLGVYVPRISEYMGISERNVHYVLTSFERRLRGNTLLRSNYEAVRNKMRKWIDRRYATIRAHWVQAAHPLPMRLPRQKLLLMQ